MSICLRSVYYNTSLLLSSKAPIVSILSSVSFHSASSSLSASIVGIGVRYNELDYGILIAEVLENSPAEKAGMQAGDIIIAVDGRGVETFESDELLNAIRGLKGTDVTVTVQRGNDKLDITITRDEISTTVTSRIEGKVGILVFNSFSDGSVKEMQVHLEKLKKAGVTSLIIDLRDNGGGYLDQARRVAGIWLDDKLVVSERRGGKETDRLNSIGEPLLNGVPTVVLVTIFLLLIKQLTQVVICWKIIVQLSEIQLICLPHIGMLFI